jgi:hypothetical protein
MTPVLDKGYVNVLGKTMDGLAVQSMVFNFNQGIFHSKFLDIPTLTLAIKAPIFVQLFLNDSGIKTIAQRSDSITVEAYVPTVAELGIRNIDDAAMIQADLARTTEALLLNPQAYQMDGCDRFLSQIVSPISVYNTVVAYGSLNQWLEITERSGLPKPIEAYRKAIQDVVHAEWAVIKTWLKRKQQ